MNYVKKTETVEAKQWTGVNTEDVALWAKGFVSNVNVEERWTPTGAVSEAGTQQVQLTGALFDFNGMGSMILSVGDWIIKGGEGFYGMNDEAFRSLFIVP